jgi:hypothetical protein
MCRFSLFIISTPRPSLHPDKGSSSVLYHYHGMPHSFHLDGDIKFLPKHRQCLSFRHTLLFRTWNEPSSFKRKSPFSKTRSFFDPQEWTRSPEMSVILYNFGTQGAIPYERPLKLNRHINWHRSNMFCPALCITLLSVWVGCAFLASNQFHGLLHLQQAFQLSKSDGSR